MKPHVLAALLAAASPLALSACATTEVGASTSNAAYATAQADVARLTTQANENVLLKPWTGPHGGVPPWDHADPALIPAAFELGIALQEAEMQAIATNPAAPTFDNTMVAMQNAGRHLDRATTIFAIMTDNVSTPAVQEVEAEWSPRLTAAYNAITFNRAL